MLFQATKSGSWIDIIRTYLSVCSKEDECEHAPVSWMQSEDHINTLWYLGGYCSLLHWYLFPYSFCTCNERNRDGRIHCKCWIWWQIGNNTTELYFVGQLYSPLIICSQQSAEVACYIILITDKCREDEKQSPPNKLHSCTPKNSVMIPCLGVLFF